MYFGIIVFLESEVSHSSSYKLMHKFRRQRNLEYLTIMCQNCVETSNQIAGRFFRRLEMKNFIIKTKTAKCCRVKESVRGMKIICWNLSNFEIC